MGVARIHPVRRPGKHPEELPTWRVYRHGKFLKAPLEYSGGVDRVEVDAGDIGVSAGSSTDGFGDAPGDEVVIGGGSN